MNHFNKYLVSCEDCQLEFNDFIERENIKSTTYRNNWKVEFLYYLTAYTF